jgi:Type I restriction enzyme R protein N terminus (HSDR_N)
MTIKGRLFPDFDFRCLNSSDFKEDSVREELVLPILKELGYSGQQIVRSKSLSHPFVKIGSKKRQINIVPDYLLKIEDTYAWVLDAKAPTENILHPICLEISIKYQSQVMLEKHLN